MSAPKPKQTQFRRYGPAAALLVAVLVTAGAFWQPCTRSERIAFLPATPGAKWVVYPSPPATLRQLAAPQAACFRATLVLEAAPADARLAVRAFKAASIVINGQSVAPGNCTGAHWKAIATMPVAGLLRRGTNEVVVCVTNRLGPPALWLRLQAGPAVLATDEQWQVSLQGAPWQAARRASSTPAVGPDSPLYGGELVLDSLKRVWPALAGLLACSLALVWAAGFWVRQRGKPQAGPTRGFALEPMYVLLGAVLIVRATLGISNLAHLTPNVGFDAGAHAEYIQYIEAKHALPLPGEGFETLQPPLYYGACAALLHAGSLSMADDQAAVVVRSFNILVGLVHCWLVLLSLRLLFPADLSAQAVGLLVAAFVPPHVYLSQYVTNEPLAALFVTLAVYLCLRLFATPKPRLGWYLALGAALGAAVLTKLTALVALPVCCAALVWHLFSTAPPRRWWLPLGTVLGACVLVCGWHYARVWAHSGTGLLPNSETDPATAWWQTPGYQTGAFYSRFGQALVSPLFSALHSFADGIYSTLWADGLLSGAASLGVRPPWNYDFLNASCLLALVPSLLVMAGLLLVLVRCLRRPEPQALLVLGLPVLFGLAIVYLSLSAPWLAHVKAFFAFPALVPFAAAAAQGWNWLRQQHRWVSLTLGGMVLLWALTVGATFWVRPNNAQTHLLRGLYLEERHQYPEAESQLREAVALDPASAEAHLRLATLLDHRGAAREAIEQYRAALRLNPEQPGGLNNLAWLLASCAEPVLRDGAEAVQLAQHACQLTLESEPMMLGTLAAAYAEAGRFEEAIKATQKAKALATAAGQQALADRNEELLQFYRQGKAYHQSP